MIFRAYRRRREFGVAALLTATVMIVATVNPAFLSRENLRDMLVGCAAPAIVGCGLTLVILTGEIDISVGSQMAVLAAMLGWLSSPSHGGLALAAVVGVVLAAGAGIGFVNGLLVTIGRVPSIIATLAMLGILRGLTEWLMGGRWITDLPASVRFLGTGAWLRVPLSLWVAGGAIAGSAALAHRTPLGVHVHAVGGNREAAFLAGLSTARIKLLAFALTGLLTAVATLVSVTQLPVIEAGIGVGFELMVVTCVVVGGTSISGGRGTILGTLLGVLLLGTLRSVLLFLKLGVMSTYWERAIQGGFILIAVLLDHLSRHAGTDSRGRACEKGFSHELGGKGLSLERVGAPGAKG